MKLLTFLILSLSALSNPAKADVNPYTLNEYNKLDELLYLEYFSSAYPKGHPDAGYSSSINAKKINTEMAFIYSDTKPVCGAHGLCHQDVHQTAEIKITEPFPQIHYSLVEGDPVYNRLGLVSDSVRLEGISVSVPKSVVENNWRYHTKNAKTDVQLPFTVDAKKYVDCIQREMKLRQGEPKAKAQDQASSPAMVTSRGSEKHSTGSEKVVPDQVNPVGRAE